MAKEVRAFNSVYEGAFLNRIAFPMGGLGAGMICLEGTGALSHVSLRHEPSVFHEPFICSALFVDGWGARLLEGPIPHWKRFGRPGSGNGSGGTTLGFPRCSKASFEFEFPFGAVSLVDEGLPVEVKIRGWSPFVPGHADDSSLPVAGLEFVFSSRATQPLEGVYSFHAAHFMSRAQRKGEVRSSGKGFVLQQPGSKEAPWEEGAFLAEVEEEGTCVDCAWFRGGWFDAMTVLWKNISSGNTVEHSPDPEGKPSAGGSLYVPFRLKPGETRRIRLCLSWYVPASRLRVGPELEETKEEKETYSPWYAGRFQGIEEVASFWRENYDRLREETANFSQCFHDTALPPAVIEAMSANLTILKSPTVLRQKDGRLWCWEGCCDSHGCCHGSCTHVWNYAQALCHLFPDLERTLRETEFFVDQDEKGHQNFRASLPIRPLNHDGPAASDGQLGGIMKVYREWRISGDLNWLKKLWPQVKKSLDYCIQTWDPKHEGVLVEPHHNTYDIEFWGPDGMCSSFYLGALKAAGLMAQTLGEEIPLYRELFEKGKGYLEEKLFNGEYFFQEVRWEGLQTENPVEAAQGKETPEALALLQKEGPKYQYGSGCLSDGVLGCWIAEVCGVGEILDRDKVKRHLLSVHQHNLKTDLSRHANPQRPTFALGEEGGLLLCSYPKGDRLTLPFPYSEEVWTGIEYQVASHLMMMNQVKQGLEVVEQARLRYDGRVRNPFNEYECGHWYARALSSYGLIQGFSGVRYDAVTGILHMEPATDQDFRVFLCTATGYGTVGVRDAEPFFDIVSGHIDVKRIEYKPRT